MKPFRRELLNGLFVLVLASLIHAAFEAFHVNFDVQVWALIVMGVAIAVSGYVVFEFARSGEERERAWTESTRQREEEWLKRVGTPARLDLRTIDVVIETVKTITPGSDYTVMFYVGAEGGSGFFTTNDPDLRREELYGLTLELLKRGTIREHKRIICFDNDVLANDHELKSGILRVGIGPGTIDRVQGEHCRVLMETKNCSVYVAPAVFRAIVALYGVNKASIGVDSAGQDAGSRRVAGTLFFSDPPNGEIVEQFRQIERATERRMVAVREIRFPEDAAPTANLAAR
jgi:hypothetical protein